MNSIKIERKHVDLLISTGFIVAGLLGVVRTIFTQEVVWVSNGLGWDGVHYDRLLKLFTNSANSPELAAFPFCGRIGTPWLLAHVFDNKISFYQFNLAISVAFSISFLIVTAPLWKGSIKACTAAITIPSFLIFAPVKFVNFYPIYMDPPFMLLLTAALFWIIRDRYIYASALCLLAIPFREAAFYILPLLVAFSLIRAEHKLRSMAVGLSTVAAGVAIKILILQIASCEGPSQVSTAFWWLYRLLTDPTRFIDVLAAISLTIAPLIFLNKNEFLSTTLLKDKTNQFAATAIVYFGLLSAVGGSDITRIFYSFAPLYASILIAAFSRLDSSGFFLACLGWLITNHVINKYEQPISEWPNSDLSGFFSQFPDHAHPVIAIVILGIWLILRASHNFFSRLEHLLFNKEVKQ